MCKHIFKEKSSVIQSKNCCRIVSFRIAQIKSKILQLLFRCNEYENGGYGIQYTGRFKTPAISSRTNSAVILGSDCINTCISVSNLLKIWSGHWIVYVQTRRTDRRTDRQRRPQHNKTFRAYNNTGTYILTWSFRPAVSWVLMVDMESVEDRLFLSNLEIPVKNSNKMLSFYIYTFQLISQRNVVVYSKREFKF